MARGYDRAWGRYSRAWLRRFPWCGQRGDGRFHVEHSKCAREGGYVLATVTDHIHALGQGGAKFDPANHQSLCYSCNARKGRTVDTKAAVRLSSSTPVCPAAASPSPRVVSTASGPVTPGTSPDRSTVSSNARVRRRDRGHAPVLA